MSDVSPFEPIIVFDQQEKINANKIVLSRVISTLFSYFSSPDMSQEEMEEVYSQAVNIASVAMAVSGMSIVGENVNGEFVTKFRPFASVEEFIAHQEKNQK